MDHLFEKFLGLGSPDLSASSSTTLAARQCPTKNGLRFGNSFGPQNTTTSKVLPQFLGEENSGLGRLSSPDIEGKDDDDASPPSVFSSFAAFRVTEVVQLPSSNSRISCSDPFQNSYKLFFQSTEEPPGSNFDTNFLTNCFGKPSTVAETKISSLKTEETIFSETEPSPSRDSSDSIESDYESERMASLEGPSAAVVADGGETDYLRDESLKDDSAIQSLEEDCPPLPDDRLVGEDPVDDVVLLSVATPNRSFNSPSPVRSFEINLDAVRISPARREGSCADDDVSLDEEEDMEEEEAKDEEAKDELYVDGVSKDPLNLSVENAPDFEISFSGQSDASATEDAPSEMDDDEVEDDDDEDSLPGFLCVKDIVNSRQRHSSEQSFDSVDWSDCDSDENRSFSGLDCDLQNLWQSFQPQANPFATARPTVSTLPTHRASRTPVPLPPPSPRSSPPPSPSPSPSPSTPGPVAQDVEAEAPTESPKEKPKKNKKNTNVHFASEEDLISVHVLEEEERKGIWEEVARDRVRFRNRINDIETILRPVLLSTHRDELFRRVHVAEACPCHDARPSPPRLGPSQPRLGPSLPVPSSL